MKILCAVSHPDVRKALTGCIQAAGHEVEPVECEADVLDSLDGNSSYDVLAMYLLPSISSLKLLELIRLDKRFSVMPAVIICEHYAKDAVVKLNGIFANEEFVPDSVMAALKEVAATLKLPATT